MAASRKRRGQVFSSSNSKPSLRTISKPTRHNNRRPANSPKRKIDSTPETYADDSDMSQMQEEPHHQTMQLVDHRARSHKDPNYNYKRYLARVLRKQNANSNEPKLTISSKAMECMSNFMSDIFDKIAEEAGQQVKKDKRKTLSDWDMKSAVKIVMPGDLGRCAHSVGYTKLQNMKHVTSVVETTKMVLDPKTGCVCPMPIPKH